MDLKKQTEIQTEDIFRRKKHAKVNDTKRNPDDGRNISNIKIYHDRLMSLRLW